jgi:heme A synthase
MPSALQLDPRFRRALYAAFATLFITGVAWLIADGRKDSANGEDWQAASAYLLMIHGGGAMVLLLLLGALFPVHIRRTWASRRNRFAGTVMMVFNALLIVTAFGLYYAGSETLRPWISDVHIAAGLLLPALIVVHVVLGRRSRRERRD